MLKAGISAPAFQLKSTSGGLMGVGSQSTPILLVFFKISCPTCQYTLPFVERVASSVTVLGISQDNPEDTEYFANEYGLTFPIVFDEVRKGYPVSYDYKITHVPTFFLVEPGGRIAASWTGFSRQDLDELGHRFGAAVFRPSEQTPQFKPG